MSIEAWWPRLPADTREWLIRNNGDAVQSKIVEAIERAGGKVTPDAWWVSQYGPDGLYLSDDAVDWVEAVANDEEPDPPISRDTR
jgi:hypothetical protein